jgi:hypothetical protein
VPPARRQHKHTPISNCRSLVRCQALQHQHAMRRAPAEPNTCSDTHMQTPAHANDHA